MSSATMLKDTTVEATATRLARYRRRMELHIQAAALRRSAPAQLPPKRIAAARAIITKYGRIEADAGLWVTVGKEVLKAERLAVARLLRALEAAGLAVRAADWDERRRANGSVRFVVALEPRQAWRSKLVEKEQAMRWEAAELAEFRFVVEKVQERGEPPDFRRLIQCPVKFAPRNR
ncbi:MAG: hypothetical protein SF066_07755 [Thermoanaerobaculia bacterium]|nr:hypothetical protein [Thermoanaerobaculia bacterium]